MGHVGLGFALVAVVFPRVGYRRRAQVVRWWSARLIRALGVKIEIKGTELHWLTPNLVIAANHISWLDIFAINSIRPTRFVAKAEIRDWPFVGWLCDKAGTIFISRARRSETAKINDVIHDVLASGDCIGLFPEGTTTAGNQVRKFHSSLFEPAVANHARVAPAAIRYRNALGATCYSAAYIDDVTFGDSIQRIIRQRGLIVEITFGALIDAQDKSRRELATQAESFVAGTLGVEVVRDRLALGGELSASTTSYAPD